MNQLLFQKFQPGAIVVLRVWAVKC